MNGSSPTTTDGVVVSSPPVAFRNKAAAGGSMTPSTRPVHQQQQSSSPSPSATIGNFFKRIRSRSKSPSLNLRKSPSQPSRSHQVDDQDQDNNDRDGSRRKSDTRSHPRTTRPTRTSSRQRIKDWFTTSPSKSNSKNAINATTINANNDGLPHYENSHLKQTIASHHEINNPRSALSEEDLVSKSLASELQQTIPTPIAEGEPKGSANNVGKSDIVAATPVGPSTMMASYHSQDSIFVVAPAPAAAADAAAANPLYTVKTPSYIRISCALNGYGPRRHPPYRRSEQRTFSPATNHAQAVPTTMMAKSIVERRLDKFQQSPSDTSSSQQGAAAAAAAAAGKPPTIIPSTNTTELSSPTTNEKNENPPQVSVRDRVEALSSLSTSEIGSPDPNQMTTPAIPAAGKPPQAQEVNGPMLTTNPQCADTRSTTITNQDEPDAVECCDPLSKKGASGPTVAAAAATEKVASSASTGMDMIIDDDEERSVVQPSTVKKETGEQINILGATPSTSSTSHNNGTSLTENVEKEDRQEIMSVNESDDIPNPQKNRSSQHQKMPCSTFNGTTSTTYDGDDINNEGGRNKLDAGGHKRRADDARGRLRALCHEADGYLQLDIPEEAGNLVRVAFGKANLLMGKKFNQFYDLIDKNLHPVDGDPEPILLDDLDGYWSIVAMEMDDVDRAFDIVRQMRSNDWTILADRDKNPAYHPLGINNSNFPTTMMNSSRPGSRNGSAAAGANSSAATKSASANAQQRSTDARKRLAEAKALARKKKQAAAASSTNDDEIQIFGATQ